MDCTEFPQIEFKIGSRIRSAKLDHLVLTRESKRNIFGGIAFVDTGPNRVYFPAIRKSTACIGEFEAALYNNRYGTSIVAGKVLIQENTFDYCLKIINE